MTDQNPPERWTFGDTGSEPPVLGEAPDPTTPIPAPQDQAVPVQTQTLHAQAAPPSAFQSAVGAAQDTKGFLPALFDFTFTHFVTPKLVRFVYLLATVALGIVWLFWVFVGFARGAGAGLAVLILGPVLFIIYLAVIRMTLEFYLSIVRMSEDVHHRLPRA
jgi:hypothetical protein